MAIINAIMAKVKNFGKDCADTIGTGPYVITEWVPNDHYTLVYNEKYWGKKPSVTKVIVSIVPDASTQNLLYQKGELDILDLESLDSTIVQSTYKTTYADKLVVAPRVGLTYLAMLRHILPNCLPSILVLFTLNVPSAILSESALSFLGIGIQPPQASWGLICNMGRQFLYTNPWLSLAPSLAIMLVVLAFNFLGDGLRDVLDPQLKNL